MRSFFSKFLNLWLPSTSHHEASGGKNIHVVFKYLSRLQSCSDQCNTTVPEITEPVFAKTSPNTRFVWLKISVFSHTFQSLASLNFFKDDLRIGLRISHGKNLIGNVEILPWHKPTPPIYLMNIYQIFLTLTVRISRAQKESVFEVYTENNQNSMRKFC
jgi:hypothetical protein